MPQFREQIDAETVQAAMLSWYDRHARSLPWRISPADRAKGISPDPYQVWLSEIMLQQTTVATVKSYFERFAATWPDVERLAAASLDDVLREWAGLGYYARARNLHKCARAVTEDHGGRFPETEAVLRTLPGVGAYTAAAIASIAFNRRATVLDGNVERVMARLFKIEEPLPGAKKPLYAAADLLTPDVRPGDYAQAVMDLGATICTSRNPSCEICPLIALCSAHRAGIAGSLPRKPARKAKPVRFGMAFVAVREDGAILLARRPESGLLGGMMEAPGSDWTEGQMPPDALDAAPIAAEWQDAGETQHTFTHFQLYINVKRANITMTGKPDRGHWLPRDEALSQALPTVMRKILSIGLS